MDLFIQPFQQTQQSMRMVTRKTGKHTHIPQNAAAKNSRRSDSWIPTTLVEGVRTWSYHAPVPARHDRRGGLVKPASRGWG